MICSQCKTRYRSEPGEISTSGTMAGLCRNCGTIERYQPFVSSFGQSLFWAVVGIESILLLALFMGWGVLALPLAAAMIYVAVRHFAHRGETVRYRNVAERKKATRKQRVAGHLAGIATGMILVVLFLQIAFEAN